jgi:DNA-binding transcriptional regulator YhcF (GntR family)
MAESVTDDVEPRHASRRVAELLARQIDAGQLAPGAQLPPYRQLAADHGIAINTAQAAIRILARSGRVVIRPSSGAFVADDPAPAAVAVSDRAELSELREQVRRARSTLAGVEQALSELIDRPAPPAPDSDIS